MEEKLLHYAFRYRLFDSLIYTNGEHVGQSVSLLSAGEFNTDAGPDFFNAKIVYGNTTLAGCIELHLKSSDWYLHRHDSDPAYDGVILHIVLEDDRPVYRSDGQPLLTAVISVPNRMQHIASELESRSSSPACIERLSVVNKKDWDTWLSVLANERLTQKAAILSEQLMQLKGDWNELTYIHLARYLGGNVNNEAFEQMARLLPYSYIRKQRGSLLQIEAMIYGSAGLIPKLDTLSEVDEITRSYVEKLDRESRFLTHKYGLRALAPSCVRMLRIRPAAFPTIRLAILSAILYQHEFLFSRLIQAQSLHEAEAIFDGLDVSTYWHSYYAFGIPRPHEGNVEVSRELRHSIIANLLCPLLVAYSHERKDSHFREKAESFLRQMPPEKNKHTKLFATAEITAANMAQSQALIQLSKRYCAENRCLSCRIGYRLLSNSVRN